VINNFVWPPPLKGNPRQESKLKLRKKISHAVTTPLESSVRTVEAFYPTQPETSHILVLSANAELAPMWYHFLFYHLLEYKYSMYNTGTAETDIIAGISLITPLFYLNQEKPLKPPRFIPPKEPASHEIVKIPTDPADPTPFLWQAPDTTATLYFGSTWQELHSFLSLRIAQESLPTMRELPPTLPAFAEPLYELMRLRGYTVLYPNLPAHSVALYRPYTTIRQEFVPFTSPDASATETSTPPWHDFEPYEPHSTLDTPSQSRLPPPKPLAASPLHNVLPTRGDLPEVNTIPCIDADGNRVTASDLHKAGETLGITFRYMTGGCLEDVQPLMSRGSAEDLFCDGEGIPIGGSLPGLPNDAHKKGVRPLDLEKLREEHAAKAQLGPGSEGKAAVAIGKSIQSVEAIPDVVWDPERGVELKHASQKESLNAEFRGHLERQAGHAPEAPSSANTEKESKILTSESQNELLKQGTEAAMLEEFKGHLQRQSGKEKPNNNERPAGW
jgi:hypothetical protein